MQLKRKHLDPVLQQLQGRDGSKLSFDDIIGVYHLIKDDYDARAVGAKDAIAAAFFDFHPVRNCYCFATSHIMFILNEFWCCVSLCFKFCVQDHTIQVHGNKGRVNKFGENSMFMD